MSVKIQKKLGIILGLLLVGVVAYGAWLLVGTFVDSIAAASPEVTAAIVGTMGTILVGISAVLISQTHDRKRAAEEAHRLKKVEIYQSFIDMLSKMIGSSNEHLSLKGLDPPELTQYLFKFKADILLWGSPGVIKAQIEFESVSGNEDPTKLFKSVNKLYLAIREDLGLSNSGLNNLELLKLYLKDDDRTKLR